MTGEDHLIGVGKIVGNLLALERLIRIFLCRAAGEKLEYPTESTEQLPETHLTNYDALGDLIDEHNAGLSEAEHEYRVDSAVVEVRDALAHGRASSKHQGFPLTLCKFGRPDSSKMVPVEFFAVLDQARFDAQRASISVQIDAVVNCSKSRKYK